MTETDLLLFCLWRIIIRDKRNLQGIFKENFQGKRRTLVDLHLFV